ncbi:MAG: c-type cytochrome [Sphingomonadales bacterium]
MFNKILTTALIVGSLSFSVTYAADGDAQKGARVWMKCKACHTINEGGRNAIGPNLFGIIGRDAGSTEGYRYSKAITSSGITWTEENLRGLVKNTRKFLKGTKMSFSGIRKDDQIDDLIAYIKEQMGPE